MLRELCKSYIITQCAFMKLIFYVENNMMALCDWACAVFLHSMWFLRFCWTHTLYAITKKRLFIYMDWTQYTLMCMVNCWCFCCWEWWSDHSITHTYIIIIVKVQRCVIFDHIMREFHITATPVDSRLLEYRKWYGRHVHIIHNNWKSDELLFDFSFFLYIYPRVVVLL